MKVWKKDFAAAMTPDHLLTMTGHVVAVSKLQAQAAESLARGLEQQREMAALNRDTFKEVNALLQKFEMRLKGETANVNQARKFLSSTLNPITFRPVGENVNRVTVNESTALPGVQ